MQLYLYNALMYLLSPLWLAVTSSQAINRRGGWQFLLTRLGWQSGTQSASSQHLKSKSSDTAQYRVLWIHAASVGEVKSILPLLSRIHSNWPNLAIHVTCTTPESLGILRESPVDGITGEYCPIDFYSATNRIFERLNPLALLIIETEIWPNLYSLASRHDVPLVIINGRVTGKTVNAPKFVLGLYRQILQHVTLILSRSEADTANFIQLGVDANCIQTIGNIKTYTGVSAQPTPVPELRDKRYLLAASTHAPEEQRLCDALKESDYLLVIAPRHVQRSSSIQQMLSSKGISFATRSRNEAPDRSTRVYLADTTGEINQLITNAEMVFVGGSLVDFGGHNVLEPAAQGKPVLTGPYYKNFTAEVALLAANHAIKIVNSAEEIAALCISHLEEHSDEHSELNKMGASAQQVIDNSKHVFEQYAQALDRLIKLWSSPQ